MKVKKGHQRPELQKIIDFMDIQCKFSQIQQSIITFMPTT